MSMLPISQDIRNTTSLLESADGVLPCALQDGQTIDLFGQVVAPASHSARQEKAASNRMAATYGRIGIGSSESQALQSSLENRLRQRLPLDGGMMWPQIWKRKTTPARRRYCQLAVLALPTAGIGFGFWLPTITANEFKGAGWKRYKGSPHFRGAKMSEGLRICETDPIYLNPSFAALTMGYSAKHLSCMRLAMQSCRKSRRNSSRQAG